MQKLKQQSGFSTLELMIAFAVLVTSLTAVVMVAFGNQSSAIDTELAQRGLYIAQANLEEAGAATLEDFDSVVSDTVPVPHNTIFDTQVTVSPISECAKRIDSTAFWNRNLRNLKSTLTTIFVNPEASDDLLGDCPVSETSDDWDNPGVFVDENITGQSDATAIDEFDHFIYLTTAPNAANKDDFFIYEFDATSITLTERSTFNTSASYNLGLNDVDVAGDYAYLASASTTDQLQVVDISDPDNPVLLWTVGLPGVDPFGSYPAATTILYYADRVYVGTSETDGPEFHIFDVTDVDTNPPTHLGSLELTHNVNDIKIQGNFAYLATSDNDHELMVIDVSDPTNLVHPDTSDLGFNAPGVNDGTSVFVASNFVYLGRAQENPPTDSFFIIDRNDTLDDTAIDDGTLGAYDIGLQNNTYVAGIRVAGRFAFIAMDDPTTGLAIYNIEDPANIFLPSSCAAFNFSENSVGIDNDLSSQYMFVANGSNAEIRIIYDQIPSCP